MAAPVDRKQPAEVIAAVEYLVDLAALVADP
jgi:hypothetical protein